MNAPKSRRVRHEAPTRSSAQAVPHDGIEVKLGGRIYIMPALSAAASKRYWERIEALRAQRESDPMGLTIQLVAACLSRNYPEIDEAWVEQHLDLDNWESLSTAVFGQKAFRRWIEAQQAAAGNVPAPQPVAAPAGTGAPSTPVSPPSPAGDTPTSMP